MVEVLILNRLSGSCTNTNRLLLRFAIVGLAPSLMLTDNLTEKFNAVKFVKVGSEIIGGQGGGGRKDFAQAGGQDQSKIDEAFEKLKTLI